jgi:class 3 adenylate cyclase
VVWPAIAEGARRPDSPAPKLKSPNLDTPTDPDRRQITVLFCDMVGSAALSGSLDPELLGDLLQRYQHAAAGAIGRFGGLVARYIGAAGPSLMPRG